jgi:hypothetical protein
MNIKFLCHPDLLDVKEIKPIPAKLSIPDWYKKIPKQHSVDHKDQTIKSCIPVLDSITAGYILTLPQDLQIQHNLFIDGIKQYKTFIGFSQTDHFKNREYNLNLDAAEHPPEQVGGPKSFMGKKNRGMGIPKFLNPWTIKTPPGYSCIFLPPMHRELDFFSILPGIVDTDDFPNKINFPFIINTEKYNTIDEVIPIGTPYVQVIPFKRDEWKMNIGKDDKNIVQDSYKWRLRIKDIYKRIVWKKKSFK